MQDKNKTIMANQNRSMQLIKIIGGIALILVATIGIFHLGKPFYQNLQASEQAKKATADLYAVQRQVIQYMKTHQTFPENLNLDQSKTENYQISFSQEGITATFTQKASPNIQGKSIVLNVINHSPLTWQCDPGKDFPEVYLPKDCH